MKKRNCKRLLYLSIITTIVLISLSSFSLALDYIERNFTIPSPLCQNQFVTVTYTKIPTDNTYWAIDDYIPSNWVVAGETLTIPLGLNETRFRKFTKSTQLVFDFMTPETAGTYTFEGGLFWTNNTRKITEFPSQTIEVENCLIPSNCTDKDMDGLLDYNPDDESVNYCPRGRDICVEDTGINFSDFKPIYLPDINVYYNWSNEDLRNVSNLRFFRPGLGQILFTKDLRLVDLDSRGCFKPLNLTSLIKIEQNRITLLKENYSEFNKTFYILFENITFKKPAIKIDGIICGSECTDISYDTSSKTYTAGITGMIIQNSYEDKTLGFFDSIISLFKDFSFSLTGNAISSGTNKRTIRPTITGNVVYEVFDLCSDGIKNGDETNVDCGGGCNACSSSEGNTGGSGGGGSSGSSDKPATINSTLNQNNLSIAGGSAGLGEITTEEKEEEIPEEVKEIYQEKNQAIFVWILILIGASILVVLALIIVYSLKKEESVAKK